MFPESVTSIKESLIKKGFKKMNITEFLEIYPNEFKYNQLELNKLNKIVNKLSGGKEIYRKIINIRSNLKLDQLKNIKISKNDKEYFDFINLNQISNFFDIGFHEGKVTKNFIKFKKNQSYKVYVFDVQKIFNDDILGNKNISFQKLAISNDSKNVFVRKLYKAESAGTYCQKNKTKIHKTVKAISLDKFVNQKKIKSVDFIKIDIEGFEKNAINGMKGIIKKFMPNIAIAIYHNIVDFYEIPELILKFNNKYKIYFNHYSNSLDGSVMYFIRS